MNVMLAVWARDRRHVEPENYLALSVLDGYDSTQHSLYLQRTVELASRW